MSKLFQTEEWKTYKIRQASIWSDGAKHFKNFELIRYHISLMENKILDRLSFNYFTEYHGKCYCDSHFSMVSRIIQDYERGHEDNISSTSELIDTLNSAFTRYNSNNQSKSRKIEAKVTQIELPLHFRVPNFETCNFDGLQLYYSFNVIDVVGSKKWLFASVTTSEAQGKRIPVRCINDTRKVADPKEPYPVPNKELKFSVHSWNKERKRAKIRDEELIEPDDAMIIEKYETVLLEGSQSSLSQIDLMDLF
jgi:hypothetical protein